MPQLHCRPAALAATYTCASLLLLLQLLAVCTPKMCAARMVVPPARTALTLTKSALGAAFRRHPCSCAHNPTGELFARAFWLSKQASKQAGWLADCRIPWSWSAPPADPPQHTSNRLCCTSPSTCKPAPHVCLNLHSCTPPPPPTPLPGVDPTPEQWQGVLEVVQQRRLLPFFDSAYQVGAHWWAACRLMSAARGRLRLP